MPEQSYQPPKAVESGTGFEEIRLPDSTRYRVVPKSYGESRNFEITVGLRAGYQDSAQTSDATRVRDTALQWMKQRAGENLPFLTGVLSTGDVLYAYPSDSGPTTHHEPVASFRGEVSTLYNRDLSDDQVRELLNELAANLAVSTEQTRVYIRYRGDTWVIQREGRSTPRGDTV